MKKLQIVDITYYNVLIVILSVLILYNSYALMNTQSLFGIVPIIIQCVLIYLLATRNVCSQKAIKVWILLVFIGLSMLKIIAAFLQAWAMNMRGDENALENLSSTRMIYTVVLILIGIILWILNSGFGEVVEVNE